jgi:hypothetical protein
MRELFGGFSFLKMVGMEEDRPHPGPLRRGLFFPDDPHPASGHLLPLPRAKDHQEREIDREVKGPL